MRKSHRIGLFAACLIMSFCVTTNAFTQTNLPIEPGIEVAIGTPAGLCKGILESSESTEFLRLREFGRAESTFVPMRSVGFVRIERNNSIVLEIPESPGRFFRVIPTNEIDPIEEERGGAAGLSPRSSAVLDASLEARDANLGTLDSRDEFRGTARKAAKISIANARRESFANLDDLLADLPTDDEMINRRPRISSDRDSERVAEEQRNIRVEAFLYAASREDDNDFHLILGDTATARRSTTYMNVELSGLPPEDHPDRDRLERVRRFYLNRFRGNVPGERYDFYDPPIPVRVSGSLFYDIDHRPGAVGPRSHRPETSWELHPVTFIEFR